MKNNNSLSKTDYNILMNLYNNQCFTELNSYTIKTISELTKLSISTVRKSINKLLQLRYIKEGASQWRSNTFFISIEGIEKTKQELRKDV